MARLTLRLVGRSVSILGPGLKCHWHRGVTHILYSARTDPAQRGMRVHLFGRGCRPATVQLTLARRERTVRSAAA